MRDPSVPETLDSWSILHRMFRFERRAFDRLPPVRQAAVAAEAVSFLEEAHAGEQRDVALAEILGHKCDLMLTHYERSFDALGAAEVRFDKLELAEYLQPVSSYVSVLELGLYEATAKIHADLQVRGLTAHSDAWNAAFDAALAEHARNPRNAARLWAKIPARRYVCFYPMNKRRGEHVNWYELPYAERARLMVEHGKVGRSFHGLVTQVISGSIGFDDYEWGVDLYADEPQTFKKLISEMRFDPVSAKYAEFGPFYTGLQFSLAQLPVFLRGEAVPELNAQTVLAPAAG
ncbi:MAG TPA: hydrogen peroxide-dependent heme synthase [Candidatus Acidoferrales bacterium]|nr:hydrogen peroxide-dependent heme synthase [Candidatus Acidoferrales bacterium]